MKVLHVCSLSVFIPPFIEFVNNNFHKENHLFFVYGDKNKYAFNMTDNTLYWRYFISKRDLKQSILRVFNFINLALKYDKVILHGAFNIYLLFLLSFFPFLLRKFYWVVWGGDLYAYNNRKPKFTNKLFHLIRKIVFRRIGHIITYVRGDYELAKKWYGSRAKYHECFMYQSNLYKDILYTEKKDDTMIVLVGNSADPTNNHLEIFKKLRKYKSSNIKIYVPLSYGDKKHASKVISQGKEFFGDKFIPLTDFMKFDEYNTFLSQVDVALFAHKRQQGMGNIITLLGMGKKVYLRSDVTSFQTFKDLNLKVHSINNSDISLFSDIDTQTQNREIIAKYFSCANLINQWGSVFND